MDCWDNDSVYMGNVSITSSGLTCQSWLASSPHEPSYVPDNAEAHMNYCRAPDQDTKVKTPWCYTTDPEIRYDYCSQIPKCSDLQPELEAATEVTLASVCFNGKIGDYHKQSGVRASMTKSGRTCQRWDSDSPHNTRNNGPHLASNRNNNYCSDHDLAAAWCYTTDPNKRWEECDITYNCDDTPSPEGTVVDEAQVQEQLDQMVEGLKEAEGKLENFVEENNEALGTIGSAVQSVMEDPAVKETANQALEAFKNQLEQLVQQ